MYDLFSNQEKIKRGLTNNSKCINFEYERYGIIILRVQVLFLINTFFAVEQR